MATLQADMMGNPFDPELAVIVTFFPRPDLKAAPDSPARIIPGPDPITIPGGLLNKGHNIWAVPRHQCVPDLRRVRYNARGVPIISPDGEIQRPPESMACNVNPPASFEKFDPREEEERARRSAVVAQAKAKAIPAAKAHQPAQEIAQAHGEGSSSGKDPDPLW